MLKAITRSRKLPAMQVERAKVLLCFARGCEVSAICQYLGLKRGKVYRCINKALSFGVEVALDDLPRTGRPPLITKEAVTWLVSVACQKPKDLGHSYELWTTRLLSKHIQQHCENEGYACLSKLGRGTASKILRRNKIKPHKVSYYLESRDPDFDVKMKCILNVYEAAQIRRAKYLKSKGKKLGKTVYISYDEKPGIQAIKNTAPDLPPVKDKHATWSRDHEYKRLGTMSLLAGIDLVTGKAHHLMCDRHRSQEFVKFLRLLDSRYSKELKIRIVLDNHSAHISKETQRYLATVPNRFIFTFTPKHASWLNLIEVFFAKMAKTVLRSIRVSSKTELKQRIKKYFKEENRNPVVFEWTYMLKAA